jgi:hypothetical protein
VTVHHYDPTGRLVRSETTVDSPWDDDQRAWMLALQVYDDTRCTGCGGNLHETTSPEHEDHYRVVMKVRCYRCDAIGQAADQHEAEYRKVGRPARMQALRFITELVPRRPRRG